MSTAKKSAAALCLALACAGELAAQVRTITPAARTDVGTRRYDWYRANSPGGYGRYGGGYGGYGGYGYGGFGTAQSAAMHGAADVMRAQADRAVGYTDAAINYEQAKSAYLDNKLKFTQIYWERQRIGKEELAKQTQADREAREKYLDWKHSQPPVEGLSPGQLDPNSGSIAWPLALQNPKFDQTRKKLDDLFALRTQTNATYDLYKSIQAGVSEMQSLLKDNIKDMNANEYSSARKFLDSMAVESQMPAG